MNTDKLMRVPIIKNVCGTSERGVCAKIGWLGISFISKNEHTYGIFVLDTGKLLVRCRFPAFLDACIAADELEKTYREYWPIISKDGYPDLSLIELCQWTVQDGLILNSMWNDLQQKDIISLDDVRKARDAAILNTKDINNDRRHFE